MAFRDDKKAPACSALVSRGNDGDVKWRYQSVYRHNRVRYGCVKEWWAYLNGSLVFKPYVAQNTHADASAGFVILLRAYNCQKTLSTPTHVP